MYITEKSLGLDGLREPTSARASSSSRPVGKKSGLTPASCSHLQSWYAIAFIPADPLAHDFVALGLSSPYRATWGMD
jgi:hypothetical protein